METSPERRKVTSPLFSVTAMAATRADSDRMAHAVLAVLRQRVREQPANPDAHFALGETLRQLGRQEQALGAYTDAINRASPEPARPEAYIHLIGAMHAIGRDDQALHVAQQGAPLCSNEPGFWLVIGQCHARLGEIPAAIGAFERCQQTSATLVTGESETTDAKRDAYLGLSTCYETEANPHAAEQALMNAEWIAGSHWQVQQARLHQLLRDRPLAEVADRLQVMLAALQGPDRRQLAVSLAGTLWLWGRPAEAQSLLEQAWASAGRADAAASLVDVSHVLLARGDAEMAVALLNEHRSLAGVPEALAILLFRIGHWQSLRTLCDSVWNEPGSRSFAASYRGIARLRLGDLAGATADCREAVAGDPENIGAWLNLGLLAMSGDRLDEAKAAFGEVVDRHRLEPAAPVNLARIALMEQDFAGVDHWLTESFNALPPALSQAVQTAERNALLAQPELAAPFGLRTLIADLYAVWGSLMLSDGDTEAGIQRLSLATLLVPTNGNHHLLIGAGLLEVHAPRLARRFFRAATTCMPRSRIAQERLTQTEQLLSDQAATLHDDTQDRFQYLDDLIAELDGQGNWP
jgi:tetratricopeptide (TPR) repeat protein